MQPNPRDPVQPRRVLPARQRGKGTGPEREQHLPRPGPVPRSHPQPHSQRRSHFIQWYTMVLWCRLFSRHQEERPWMDSMVLVTACSFLSSEASSAPADEEAAAEEEEARPPPPPPAAIFPRCSPTRAAHTAAAAARGLPLPSRPRRGLRGGGASAGPARRGLALR